jgi:hypothetical protein
MHYQPVGRASRRWMVERFFGQQGDQQHLHQKEQHEFVAPLVVQ